MLQTLKQHDSLKARQATYIDSIQSNQRDSQLCAKALIESKLGETIFLGEEFEEAFYHFRDA
jgi:hypothetical protein